MSHIERSSRLMATGATAFILMAAAAQAQDRAIPAAQVDTGSGSGAGANHVEEIVVTAQKRKENLQVTPIAITAVTGESIARKGLSDIGQVVQFAPNVHFDTTSPISGASNAASVFIRGIGQTDFALTTDAGVGTYVDGVYMSRSLGGVMDVLDVERVEILRGPQGTLFGRNTIGGAISINSRMPDQQFGGMIETTIGDAGRRYLRGSINLPIDDATAIRISVSSKERDGYVTSAFPGGANDLGYKGLTDLGNENRQAARALLTHEFSSRLKALLTADIGRVRENNAADRLVGITGTPANGPIVFAYNLFGAPGATLPGFADARYSETNFVTGKDTTYATGPNGTRLDSWGTSLTLNYEASPALAIKSISAYRATRGSFNRDADGSPLPLLETSNYAYRQAQWSEELQFIGDLADHRLKYVAGLYYFNETGSDPLVFRATQEFGTIYQDVVDVTNRSYAAFLQASYKVSDRLSVTVGGRYSHDSKQLLTDQYIVTGTASQMILGVPAGSILPLIPRNSFGSVSYNNFSPRVSLDYKLDGLLLYASYSKGFKGGGFNLRYVAARSALLPFNPEKATTFEAGFKWDGLDRRARLNVSAFTTDYRDIQVTVYENLGAPVIMNAGDARIKGIEAEFTATPISGVELNANLGYLDARYTRIGANPALASTPQQIISTANHLPKSPKFQGSIGGSYTYGLGDGAKLDMRADMSFSSSFANDAQNSIYLNQKPYQIVNMSAGYTAPAHWSARVFVENLTNQRYIVSGDSNYGIGSHEANFNRPRQWGVSFTYRF